MQQFLRSYFLPFLFLWVMQFGFSQEKKIESNSPRPMVYDAKNQNNSQPNNSEKTEKAIFPERQNNNNNEQLIKDVNDEVVTDTKVREDNTPVADYRVINLTVREPDINRAGMTI